MFMLQLEEEQIHALQQTAPKTGIGQPLLLEKGSIFINQNSFVLFSLLKFSFKKRRGDKKAGNKRTCL